MITGSGIIISLAIFVLYLILCLIIGIQAYKKDMSDLSFTSYYLANRTLSAIEATGTCMATLFSSFTFLGAVGIMYANGIGFNNLILGEIFMIGLLMPTVGYRYWKLAMQYGYTTPSDAVADRFDDDKVVRVLVGIGNFLFTFFYIGVQIVGIAYVVRALSGNLIPYSTVVIVIAAVLAIYIVLGGLYSVVRTDLLQIFMVMIALIAVFVALFTQDFGGHVQSVLTSDKAVVMKTQQPLLGWLSSFIAFGVGLFFWPQLWQRTFAVKQKVSLWYMGMGMMIGTLVLTFALTYPVALWGAGEWPTLEALGTSADQIMIRFAIQAMPVALAALVLSGATAASMSTVDSQILTITSIIQRDLIEKPFNIQLDEARRIVIGRWLTVGLIVLTTIAALYPPPLITGLVIDTAYPGFCGMAPAIILGLYWRRATAVGARWSILIGMLTALLIIAANKLGIPALAPLKDLFGLGLYPGFWALVVGAVVMYVVSLLSAPTSVSTLRRFGFEA